MKLRTNFPFKIASKKIKYFEYKNVCNLYSESYLVERNQKLK